MHIKIYTQPAKVSVKCKCCNTEFKARAVDVKRGWGKFCSKSCKATAQERRTGQMRKYLQRQNFVRTEALNPHDYDHASWESDREEGKDYA